jgi:hypothetical protein
MNLEYQHFSQYLTEQPKPNNYLLINNYFNLLVFNFIHIGQIVFEKSIWIVFKTDKVFYAWMTWEWSKKMLIV